MTPLPSLKETIATHGLSAKKSFGQHFLLDMNITAKIAYAAGVGPGDHVIEIGPGPGGLTRALLAAGAEVWAVEKDVRCIAALNELTEHYPGKLYILEADALEIDLTTLCAAPRKIVANLPYNVGTPLLIRWLEDIYQGSGGRGQGAGSKADPRPLSPVPYSSLTLMFQKEVAQRIAAAPDTDDYGRLAVISQWLTEVKPRFDLPPGAFSPPPKVHSSVITLTPRSAPLFPVPKKALERVLAAAFGNRRKMLRQSLKSLGVDTEALLAKAGIDGTRRAETLEIEAFCCLAQMIMS